MLTRHSNFDISVKERMNCPLTLWKILICRLIFSLIKKTALWENTFVGACKPITHLQLFLDYQRFIFLSKLRFTFNSNSKLNKYKGKRIFLIPTQKHDQRTV